MKMCNSEILSHTARYCLICEISQILTYKAAIPKYNITLQNKIVTRNKEIRYNFEKDLVTITKIEMQLWDVSCIVEQSNCKILSQIMTCRDAIQKIKL